MRHDKIALIPGDGIGVDVNDATMQVLTVAAQRFGFDLRTESFRWSCQHCLDTGAMMPEGGIATLRPIDAIYLGAVG